MKKNQEQSAEHYTYQWGGNIAEFLRTSEAASVTPGKQLGWPDLFGDILTIRRTRLRRWLWVRCSG